MDHSVFVPNGDSRRDTATLLVGTAEEFGISQKSIRSTSKGFFITEELADKVYEDGAPEAEEAEESEDSVYEDWDYQDLKAEVAKRDLKVKDQKTETLIAALTKADSK